MSASTSTDLPAADEPTDVRILAAAQRQLFAYGYNALTMDDLAHELGISKKTLYLHFPGKDAIIGIVIDGIGRVIRSGMESVLNDPKLLFAQKLRGIVDVVVPRLSQASPAMLRELQRYAPRIHQKIDELRQKNIPYVFGRLFRAGIAEGAVRADLDPDFAAQFWLQVMRGLTQPDTLAITQLTPKQTLGKALELFTGGMLTPAGRKDYEKLFPAKFVPLVALGLLGLAGCARSKPGGYQGYLEGEFIYVSSPLAGRLENLAVQKGARVAAGAPLFTLERSAELATQRQAADQLRAAQARLEDLKKGSRPSELAALDARRAQAVSAADLSAIELKRQQLLFDTRVIPASDFDRARLSHEKDLHVVDELTSQLATASLGARSDTIAAAAADVSAAAAAKEHADWSVDQKTQSAPKAALVYDTLYREGEFITAGNPAVALLPPENLKVRFFVPENEFASLHAGAAVQVALTGVPTRLAAHISYLSPEPEFTPPVLYNRDNRAKLVFMVEAVFDADPRDLHPGQPADVTLDK